MVVLLHEQWRANVISTTTQMMGGGGTSDKLENIQVRHDNEAVFKYCRKVLDSGMVLDSEAPCCLVHHPTQNFQMIGNQQNNFRIHVKNTFTLIQYIWRRGNKIQLLQTFWTFTQGIKGPKSACFSFRGSTYLLLHIPVGTSFKPNTTFKMSIIKLFA